MLDEEEVPADVGPAVWERIEQARLEILGSQERLVEEIENATSFSVVPHFFETLP